MTDSSLRRAVLFHLGVIAVLFALQFILPAYHHTNFARIMVLASYAIGYNILVGYTGLMSLGHAMFFAAGLYGAGLTIHYLAVPAPLGFLLGVAAGTLLADGRVSVGIVLGAALIVLAPVLIAIYVRWANRSYDPQIQALRDKRRAAKS